MMTTNWQFQEYSKQLKLSNSNTTIAFKSPHSGWNSAKTATPMLPGKMYKFEFVIDQYDELTANLAQFMFGLCANDNNKSFLASGTGDTFCSLKKPPTLISVGFAPLLNQTYVDTNVFPCAQQQLKIKNGTSIQFEVDMTQVTPALHDELQDYLLQNPGACRRAMIPNLPVCTVVKIFCNGTMVDCLYHIQGMELFAAVSITHGQVVTIKEWK